MFRNAMNENLTTGITVLLSPTPRNLGDDFVYVGKTQLMTLPLEYRVAMLIRSLSGENESTWKYV